MHGVVCTSLKFVQSLWGRLRKRMCPSGAHILGTQVQKWKSYGRNRDTKSMASTLSALLIGLRPGVSPRVPTG